MINFTKKLFAGNKKLVVGLVEDVLIYGKKSKKLVSARMDTGATKSSIDKKLAEELRLGPIIESRLVKSASGSVMRPVITARIKMAGKEVEAKFTVAERSHMRYKMLIGQNILRRGDFIIDPCKGDRR